jgi:hypothetical protein
MADDVDIANSNVETDLQRRIAAARADIPAGVEGECTYCGEDSPRLIGGACAVCRDKYGLD